MKTCLSRRFGLVLAFLGLLGITAEVRAAEGSLFVGWATADITPPKPVALIGQLHKRISTGVRDPLTATVLALETRGQNGDKEQAVLVSCDLLFIERVAQKKLQAKLLSVLPDFETRKIFLNATHTHDGPGFSDSTFKGLYDVSTNAGVMKASEYADFFVERVSKAVVQAWEARQPGGMSWALGSAVVGFNRREQFFDGKTVMYGSTSATNFSSFEGHEDHSLKLLFFWKPGTNLSGLVINLACTSQETENLNEVSADFWHDVRLELHRRHGQDLFVLPQCAPAGDQSPHVQYRAGAEKIMDARRGLTRRQEIARRIANGIDDVLAIAKTDIKEKMVFRHTVAEVDLPEQEPPAAPFYETDSVHPAEVHVMRLGDVAVATSPFELYHDYAMRIEGRSQAMLTFLVQLCSGNSGYLPTAKGVSGGGYSADKFRVGPEGGQVLVEKTLTSLNALWP